MKKALLFASALLLVMACNNFQTETYVDDIVVPLEEGQPDSLFLSINLEYVVTGMKVEARQLINSAIVANAFDLEDTGDPLEETAIRYRENLIDEYLNENAVLEEGVRSWEDHLEGSFQARYKNWLNYRITYYSFRGGAHGIQTVTNLVFNTRTGQPVTEALLFAPGYEAPVAALMRAAVRSSLEAEAPELLELTNLEAVVPNGNFSVDADGVEWLFQPYEVGPYVLGVVSARLGWEQLQAYLN